METYAYCKLTRMRGFLFQPLNLRKSQRYFAVFTISLFILRIGFGFGFINPVADILLETVFFASVPALIFLFPDKDFPILWRILIKGFLILIAIPFLFFLLFQFFAIDDVFRTGKNPALETVESSSPNPFLREVTYVSDCGATCAFDTFQVWELMPIPYVLKIRIPWTLKDLPN